jgi:hypothetical protein
MKKTTFVLVLVCLAILGCGGPGSGRAGTDRGEAWLSNTINGQRVGYSVYRFDQYAGGYRFESSIKMTVAMAGKTQRVQSKSVANTGTDLTLDDFTFYFSTGERTLSAKGRIAGGELTVELPGQAPRTVQVARAVYPAAALGRLVVTRNLSKDSVYKVPVFDASVMNVITAEVRVFGKEKVTAGGREYDALKFTTRMAKLEMTTWVDDKGMAVAEKSPPNMTAERSSPDEVMKSQPAGAGLDVLMVFRVPVDTTIPDNADVNRLKLELVGVDPEEHDLTGPGQEVVTKAPLVVDIKTPELPSEPVILPVNAEAEFLKPTVSIQCDAGPVKEKTAEAIGGERDGVAAVRKLTSWLFTTIEKQPTASFPTAVDVLKTMRGDCNEHAVLFAAMARAAGIPAKMAVGLIYMNRAFYYHAWNEVFLGKWIPADATFGEFPASALHLKLAEGDLSQQAEILGLVGSIKIEVKEFGLAPAEQQ